MNNIKLVRKDIINRVYKHSDESGLCYKDYGRSTCIWDYSEEEIYEMLVGVYRDKKYLLVDGDYFINLNDVIQTGCILEDVTYYKKPPLNVKNLDDYNVLQNIRTFYVKGYFLMTKEKTNGINKHFINSYLRKIKIIHLGRNRFNGLYRISNTDKVMQNFTQGVFSKDLFHPIKFYINDVFYDDQYKIDDFIVESIIKISH